MSQSNEGMFAIASGLALGPPLSNWVLAVNWGARRFTINSGIVGISIPEERYRILEPLISELWKDGKSLADIVEFIGEDPLLSEERLLRIINYATGEEIVIPNEHLANMDLVAWNPAVRQIIPLEQDVFYHHLPHHLCTLPVMQQQALNSIIHGSLLMLHPPQPDPALHANVAVNLAAAEEEEPAACVVQELPVEDEPNEALEHPNVAVNLAAAEEEEPAACVVQELPVEDQPNEALEQPIYESLLQYGVRIWDWVGTVFRGTSDAPSDAHTGSPPGAGAPSGAGAPD